MNGRKVASKRVRTLADQELELGPRGVAEDVVGLDHWRGRAGGKAIVSRACWVSRGRWKNTGIKLSSAIVRLPCRHGQSQPPAAAISLYLVSYNMVGGQAVASALERCLARGGGSRVELGAPGLVQSGQRRCRSVGRDGIAMANTDDAKQGGDNKNGGVYRNKTQDSRGINRTPGPRASSAALVKHRDIERLRVKGRECGDRGPIWGRHGADAGDRRHRGIVWGRGREGTRGAQACRAFCILTVAALHTALQKIPDDHCALAVVSPR